MDQDTDPGINGPNNPHEQTATGAGTAPAVDKDLPPKKPTGGVPKPTPADGPNNPHEQ